MKPVRHILLPLPPLLELFPATAQLVVPSIYNRQKGLDAAPKQIVRVRVASAAICDQAYRLRASSRTGDQNSFAVTNLPAS